MLQNFRNHIHNDLSFLLNKKLLIAISGGLDSVVLTSMCHDLKLNMVLAHCNFKLRGGESDDDEQFVLDLAERLDLELFTEHFQTESYAKDHKLSIQMAARELRYSWFEDLRHHLQFDYILTAHHVDDNLETFLINLSRGTGLDGLLGIPEINGSIIRPLLPFSREAIERYANEKGLQWREDSSNASSKYLRNALRLEVIPKLKALNPHFLKGFMQTQEHLHDASVIIDDTIDEISDHIIDVREDGVYYSIDHIQALEHPKAYMYQLLKPYGFTEWQDVLDLLTAQSGKFVLSDHWRLLKDRTHLILTEINSQDHDPMLLPLDDSPFETPCGKLTFSRANTNLDHDKSSIFVDKDKLEFPLILRPWLEGDVFQPLGMEGTKKLSKFFKDEKMSLVDKENTWLLCSDDAIVWIIGKRMDERFKVTAKTQDILKIEIA